MFRLITWPTYFESLILLFFDMHHKIYTELATNIFFCVILVTKLFLDGLSCNFLITIYSLIVVKHFCSVLFWPILYISPFFSVKGFAFLISLCFYCTDNVPSIWHILKKSLTSFNHLGFV